MAMYEALDLLDIAGICKYDDPTYILRDCDCCADTPVWFGIKPEPIYGKSQPIYPRKPGRRDTPYQQETYLEHLLPLEEYECVRVLFSGGKDSLCAYLHLRELGVPKEKIILHHHDIDGGNTERIMDWKCTRAYVEAFAKAEGVKLEVSWREKGFFGELYRLGASEPVSWQDPDTGEVMRCKLTPNYIKSQQIRESDMPEAEKIAALKELGYRFKWPAKGSIASGRYCSAYLKSMVLSSVISSMDSFPEKTLVVSGERAGESHMRSNLDEMQLHARSNSRRTIHAWKCVFNFSERDVWEVIKRNHINPHPVYRASFSRCSCSACIFLSPELWATFREIYPEEFEMLKEDEKRMNFTIDARCDLENFVGDAKPRNIHCDARALHSLRTGEFNVDEVYVKDWKYPAGAFRGSEGGSPC